MKIQIVINATALWPEHEIEQRTHALLADLNKLPGVTVKATLVEAEAHLTRQEELQETLDRR